jgi:nicotinamide-nucleotide amidase
MASMDDLKAIMLRGPRLTLAVAESLTGGRLQARITSISGASEFFLGGMTAYSLDQKVRHLGVNRAEAEAVNSVSAGVAEQMARGACEHFGADVAAATTGYAEPAAKWNVAAPFAWWGLARRMPDGGFALRSGRVDLAGLTRVDAQDRMAQATVDALVGWLREPAAGRTT